MEKRLNQLDLNQIEITDPLFGRYVTNVSQKTIHHQWKILNDQLEDAPPSYCIQNFRIAAGLEKGERRGVVFLDTDLYKWLETVSYCLAAGRAVEVEAVADEAIELIEKAQEPDGYLNTYYTICAPDRKWSNLVEGHELYTAGHMIEAAVAYYQAVKKERFLNIARKKADLICGLFGYEEGRLHGYPGHQEIELALVKLYRVTGEERYLKTAEFFIRQRGKKPNYFEQEIAGRNGYEFFSEFENYDLAYSQSHIEPILQKTAEGHAVRLVYMCAAMADLAAECSDKELLSACQKIWNNLVNSRMYITGGIGSSGYRERFTTDYDLPNRTNYSETCASVGLMMFGQRMAALTRDASYYDVVERALYNNVMAGVNQEGDRYFYVNPLEVVPEFCTSHTYMDHVKPVRQKWFSVACCPPNVARTLASLGQYIYARGECELYLNQFISSRIHTMIQTKTEEGKLELELDSQLLQTGKIRIRLQTAVDFRLKVRKPSYAGKTDISLDDQRIEPATEQGYLVIALQAGAHEIVIDFDIQSTWTGANKHVRENAGKAALVRGPLVYCMEEIDNGRFLSEIYIEDKAAVWEEAPVSELAGNIPVLCCEGVRIDVGENLKKNLYGQMELQRVPVKLKAIPYCLWNNRGEGEMSIWQKLRI